MPKSQPYLEAEQKIQQALKSGATELDLNGMGLTELPPALWKLKSLKVLKLGYEYTGEKNQLKEIPKEIGQLMQLTQLNLSSNKLTILPDSLGQLTQLTELNLSSNQLTALPDSLGQLTQLQLLFLVGNQLTVLPDSLAQLSRVKNLSIGNNPLINIPEWIGNFLCLEELNIYDLHLKELPAFLSKLVSLTTLIAAQNLLTSLPEWIYQLNQLQGLIIFRNRILSLSERLGEFSNLQELWISGNQITSFPASLINLKQLKELRAYDNQITDLPPSLAQLEHLKELDLRNNPLSPALQSAYDACKKGGGKHKDYDPLWAYLRSLETNAEPLYEAKLVLVGEGNVGKTTLLKALKGKAGAAPQEHEPTTHGVEIDIHGLRLPHPQKNGVEIQLNAWDFGGQDVYRVTHQFFFSRRSLYLLVWEPRRGVQQCQVEDWLNMIRLRVGDEARVIIVSTYSKSGEHIARIDKPVFQQQYGKMIVGFHEVDSLTPDEATGEMFGIAELKKVIAEESAKLEQMGMLFNNNWKAARDELLARQEPRISFSTFSGVCAAHSLSQIDTDTLAHLMHDLGYIVHYSEDEKLRDDVVLKPQWLTKAIGFVLEDRATAEHEGILPDKHLYEVWHDHPFEKEERYDPDLYPFFLRLMEKYDVSYRLPEGDASLVAQHVPQIRPNLPWLPEDKQSNNLRRIAMVCSMEEDPPGLVPWMIVRTHDYSVEQGNHYLHWQKGMFLSHSPHGEAMLEKRGREFHVYAQATYPEYFMNVLQETLQKLITDNWPGMEDRYRFMVPCPTANCKGRFNIQALRQFMSNGVREYPCQECFKSYPITKLLLGFEELPIDIQLREIKEQLVGMDSRVAHYFMALMNAISDEAKNGPRLFTFRTRETGFSLKPLLSRPLELQLWCEAEGCQHPVIESGKGVYPIDMPHEWLVQVAPYANFALKVLSTVAPIAAPAINTFFGSKTTEKWGIADQLSLASAVIGKLPAKIETSGRGMTPGKMLSELERSGILALHRFINEVDPTQDKLGLHRVATYTGDYRWLCKHHYDAWQPNIPDVIQSHD